MHLEVGVFFTESPLTDKDALERYRAYREHRELDRWDEPSPEVEAFLDELCERFPPPEDLPPEERAECPWEQEFDVSEGHVLIDMNGNHCEEAVDSILALSEKHGLVCFDPQARSILTAPPGLHIEAESNNGLLPLTVITLLLAIASLLITQ